MMLKTKIVEVSRHSRFGWLTYFIFWSTCYLQLTDHRLLRNAWDVTGFMSMILKMPDSRPVLAPSRMLKSFS